MCLKEVSHLCRTCVESLEIADDMDLCDCQRRQGLQYTRRQVADFEATVSKRTRSHTGVIILGAMLIPYSEDLMLSESRPCDPDVAAPSNCGSESLSDFGLKQSVLLQYVAGRAGGSVCNSFRARRVSQLILFLKQNTPHHPPCQVCLILL